MLIAERLVSYGRGEDGKFSKKKYLVGVYDQPLWRKLLYEAYHYYDMRVPLRVPGFRRLERLARRFGGEHRGIMMVDPDPVRIRDRIVRWSVMQDLRCYDLSHAKRKRVGELEITEEQYNTLG